jgi:glyoxylase-like metal-dependent hydrolase (beta-lactamase superfamily II)
MIAIADGLFQLAVWPRHAINVYLMGDVLIDSGTRFDAARILRQLRGRTVSAHALTHAHPDHQGSSRRICKALGIPLWCGEGDADAMETPGGIVARMPAHPFNRLLSGPFSGPPHPVARRLVEGDDVAGFSVLETPGHTAGHLSYWRASDRVLVLGDILANIHFLTGRAGLREPPFLFSADARQNRRSAQKIAELEPAVICFGHGPPLRDTRQLLEFVTRLRV